MLGAERVQVYGVHALFSDIVAERFAAEGLGRPLSCDGVPHPSNALSLGSLIADAVKSFAIQ